MIKSLVGFIRKELVQTLRDPRMRVVLFIMPMVQLALFGFALSTEIKNVTISYKAEPNDYVVDEIYRAALSSGWFIEANQIDGLDPFSQVESGRSDVVLVAPPGGFTKSLTRGDAELQILVNAINVTKAQSVEAYLRSIISRVVLKHLELEDKVEPPIKIEQRILFNPELDTSVFMVPGIMAMLMLITTMVLANAAIVREKELGTFEMLISAPISKGEIILGKTVPYVVMGISSFPLVLALAVFVFDVPMRGNFFALLVVVVAFSCTAVAIGTLISTYCQNQQQANLASFLLIFPMVMFSGLMFPVENMPDYLQWLAVIDPLTHLMGLLRNIMLKGGGWYYVIKHVSILLTMAIVLVYLSLRRFHTTL